MYSFAVSKSITSIVDKDRSEICDFEILSVRCSESEGFTESEEFFEMISTTLNRISYNYIVQSDVEASNSILQDLNSLSKSFIPDKILKWSVLSAIARVRTIGYCRERKWSAAIRCLTKFAPSVSISPDNAISQGLQYHAAVDCLLLLTEAFSCSARHSEAMQYAKLAVSSAQDQLKLMSEGRLPNKVLGITLFPPVALAVAYHDLAQSLEHNGIGQLAGEWHLRAVAMAEKYELDRELTDKMKDSLELTNAFPSEVVIQIQAPNTGHIPTPSRPSLPTVLPARPLSAGGLMMEYRGSVGRAASYGENMDAWGLDSRQGSISFDNETGASVHFIKSVDLVSTVEDVDGEAGADEELVDVVGMLTANRQKEVSDTGSTSRADQNRSHHVEHSRASDSGDNRSTGSRRPKSASVYGRDADGSASRLSVDRTHQTPVVAATSSSGSGALQRFHSSGSFTTASAFAPSPSTKYANDMFEDDTPKSPIEPDSHTSSVRSQAVRPPDGVASVPHASKSPPSSGPAPARPVQAPVPLMRAQSCKTLGAPKGIISSIIANNAAESGSSQWTLRASSGKEVRTRPVSAQREKGGSRSTTPVSFGLVREDSGKESRKKSGSSSKGGGAGAGEPVWMYVPQSQRAKETAATVNQPQSSLHTGPAIVRPFADHPPPTSDVETKPVVERKRPAPIVVQPPDAGPQYSPSNGLPNTSSPTSARRYSSWTNARLNTVIAEKDKLSHTFQLSAPYINLQPRPVSQPAAISPRRTLQIAATDHRVIEQAKTFYRNDNQNFQVDTQRDVGAVPEKLVSQRALLTSNLNPDTIPFSYARPVSKEELNKLRGPLRKQKQREKAAVMAQELYTARLNNIRENRLALLKDETVDAFNIALETYKVNSDETLTQHQRKELLKQKERDRLCAIYGAGYVFPDKAAPAVAAKSTGRSTGSTLGSAGVMQQINQALEFSRRILDEVQPPSAEEGGESWKQRDEATEEQRVSHLPVTAAGIQDQREDRFNLFSHQPNYLSDEERQSPTRHRPVSAVVKGSKAVTAGKKRPKSGGTLRRQKAKEASDEPPRYRPPLSPTVSLSSSPPREPPIPFNDDDKAEEVQEVEEKLGDYEDELVKVVYPRGQRGTAVTVSSWDGVDSATIRLLDGEILEEVTFKYLRLLGSASEHRRQAVLLDGQSSDHSGNKILIFEKDSQVVDQQNTDPPSSVPWSQSRRSQNTSDMHQVMSQARNRSAFLESLQREKAAAAIQRRVRGMITRGKNFHVSAHLRYWYAIQAKEQELLQRERLVEERMALLLASESKAGRQDHQISSILEESEQLTDPPIIDASMEIEEDLTKLVTSDFDVIADSSWNAMMNSVMLDQSSVGELNNSTDINIAELAAEALQHQDEIVV